MSDEAVCLVVEMSTQSGEATLVGVDRYEVLDLTIDSAHGAG